MRVRVEKGLKDEGTTLRYRHLSSLKSGLESSTNTYLCIICTDLQCRGVSILIWYMEDSSLSMKAVLSLKKLHVANF